MLLSTQSRFTLTSTLPFATILFIIGMEQKDNHYLLICYPQTKATSILDGCCKCQGRYTRAEQKIWRRTAGRSDAWASDLENAMIKQTIEAQSVLEPSSQSSVEWQRWHDMKESIQAGIARATNTAVLPLPSRIWVIHSIHFFLGRPNNRFSPSLGALEVWYCSATVLFSSRLLSDSSS